MTSCSLQSSPGQLVVLKYAAPGFGGRRGGVSERISSPLYFLYADESRALDGVTAISDGQRELHRRGESATRADLGCHGVVLRHAPDAAAVSVGPSASETSERTQSQGPAQRRAVENAFGADPDVVGRIVDIDGSRTEVVGVMPPGFTFLWPNIDLRRPLGSTARPYSSVTSSTWG